MAAGVSSENTPLSALLDRRYRRGGASGRAKEEEGATDSPGLRSSL